MELSGKKFEHKKSTITKKSKKNIFPLVAYDGKFFDVMLHALIGKYTGWLSPASVNLAMFDWLSHLAIAPAKQMDLAKSLCQHWLQFAGNLMNLNNIHPINAIHDGRTLKNEDPRFKKEEWHYFPFNLYADAFLSYNQWWDEATSSLPAVTKHHQQVVSFVVRQLLDTCSPSNFPFTNPEVIKVAIQEGGANFVHGFYNFIEDAYRILNNLPPAGTENFKVGVNLAITPGKVIYKNHLIELIQYHPTTSLVYAEPVLIIPAWIMKYYILDLSSHNSLVKYLVDQGHTVFMISWKNPDSNDRDLGLEDYLNLGIMSSLDVINQIVPNQKIHTAGYCLGGTLLMIAASMMAHLDDDRLKSITLFAAQVDFRDPGELSLFIDQSQISYLEDIMFEKGYLDGAQMAWGFSMLRTNDLIWSRIIHHYLLGRRRPLIDLIAWNYDTTRLPLRMHSEYLRSLFLNNDLVQGRFTVNRKRVSLTDIKIPIFAVSTTEDHISPWRSVYKIHLFTNTGITFVLTSGGHNAGIVNEPEGKRSHSFHINVRKPEDKYMSSDTWLENASKHEGSWWPVWNDWLAHPENNKIPPPAIGNPKAGLKILCDAPGMYVLED